VFATCHRFPGWLAASGLAVLVCAEASQTACDKPERAQSPAFQDPPPPPKVKFTDVTSSAGLALVRGRADRVGSGCAFLDFDGDSDQDIVLVHAAPAGTTDNSSANATPALFANDGSGKFADVTRGSGLDVSFGAIGVAAGDYDNDGFCDLFFTGGGNRLFRGKGAGRFEDVTSEAGVGGRPNQRATSASWLDYNNDGFLDLFAGGSGDEGLSLYKNDGKGRFTNVSRASGLRRHGRGVPLCLSVVAGDLDDDGWIDVIAANEGGPSLVFHNQRNGTFAEVGGACKLAYDAYGNPTHSRGIDLAWCDDDDSITVAIGGKPGDTLRLFVGRGQRFRFADETMREGIGSGTRHYSTFGVAFLDYDLDGWQDLLTVSGESSDGRDAAQSLQLFWNQGQEADGGFQAVAADAASGDLFQPLKGRGVACGDIDGDADLDLLITQSGRSPALLRNDQQTGHRSLRVRLVGSRSARDGIGARLVFSNARRSWRTQVMPARGYLSQSELPITIGFGKGDTPEELEIRWPSGLAQKLRVKAGERSLTVVEPSKARLAVE
jgi:hypothetical protein